MHSKNKINVKKLSIIAMIIIFLVFIYVHFSLNNYLNIASFNKYKDTLLLYKQNSVIFFTLEYVLIYIVLIIACIPGTIILDLLAGFLFGYFFGSVLVIFSYSIGALLNFFLVRYLFIGLFKNKFTKFKSVINGDSDKDLLLNLIGLRLIPVLPFWIINVMASLLNVRLWVFVFSTIIGIIPISIIYAIIGDGLREVADEFSSKDITKLLWSFKIWIPLVLVAVLTMLPSFIKIIKNKKGKI